MTNQVEVTRKNLGTMLHIKFNELLDVESRLEEAEAAELIAEHYVSLIEERLRIKDAISEIKYEMEMLELEVKYGG